MRKRGDGKKGKRRTTRKRGDGKKGKLIFVHNGKYLRADLGSGTNLKPGDRVIVKQLKNGNVLLVPVIEEEDGEKKLTE